MWKPWVELVFAKTFCWNFYRNYCSTKIHKSARNLICRWRIMFRERWLMLREGFILASFNQMGGFWILVFLDWSLLEAGFWMLVLPDWSLLEAAWFSAFITSLIRLNWKWNYQLSCWNEGGFVISLQLLVRLSGDFYGTCIFALLWAT